MKTMKKIASILLVLMMIQALAITAFAEEHTSITITNAQPGETYTIYKLFDLSVNLTDGAYSYTINSEWKTFFETQNLGGQYVTLSTDKGEVYVTNISDKVALANAAANWAGKPTNPTKKTADNSTVVFNSLGNGYWLVTSTLGTEAMTETTPANSAVTIAEKNTASSVGKEVQEDATEAWGKNNDAQIGDTIEFKATVTIGKNAKKVVFYDTMTDGLTFNAASLYINGLTKDKDYTVKTDNVHTFIVEFDQGWLDGLNDQTTKTILYDAILNENAVKNSQINPQTNTAYITFGDKSKSVEVTTTTTTYNFSVFKHADGKNENLADATFELYKGDVNDENNRVKLVAIGEDGLNYRVAKAGEEGVTAFTTVATGNITIWGVDADADYKLVETAAPAGYNKLKDPVSVKVEDHITGTQPVDVINNTGKELPSTGGMGTTIFYVFGGTLVLAAIVLLVAKKRMNNAN